MRLRFCVNFRTFFRTGGKCGFFQLNGFAQRLLVVLSKDLEFCLADEFRSGPCRRLPLYRFNGGGSWNGLEAGNGSRDGRGSRPRGGSGLTSRPGMAGDGRRSPGSGHITRAGWTASRDSFRRPDWAGKARDVDCFGRRLRQFLPGCGVHDRKQQRGR
jgi:hypothetical protein